MRCVAVKTLEQQGDMQSLHRMRRLMVKQRTRVAIICAGCSSSIRRCTAFANDTE
jgi:hypothetical protein